MTATLPAQLLYIAAQFAHNDPYRQILCGISIKRVEDMMTILSTNGHHAFRVSFEVNEQYHMDEENLVLDAKAFKKRIAKARYTVIRDNVAEFKDINGSMLTINPVENIEGTYPNMDAPVWPGEYKNNPGAPVAFSAKYLSTFLNEVARFGVNGTAKMEINTPTAPMQYSASIEAFSDAFEVYYLLMPVQIRK